MAIVSSTDGSPTYTGWKRRSRAASFSMCLRYSSRVVAPTTCSSPRARAGFSMLEASMAPSAAPAPTSVCSSSMKTMYFPSALVISLSTALSRSSNSPRYLVPAISEPRSSPTTCLLRSESGTSPFTMRWASPSTIAVLPTPGSPIKTGLFLVRRHSTCITRQRRLGRRARLLREARDFPLGLGLELGDVDPGLLEQRDDDAVVLREQRLEEMSVVDDGVAARARQRARLLQGLCGLHGQTFWIDHSARPAGQPLCRL